MFTAKTTTAKVLMVSSMLLSVLQTKQITANHLRMVDQVCYGAQTSLFDCSGYKDLGYYCSDGFCAIERCVGTCENCAIKYENAVIDEKSGRCCDSISDEGECVNPRDGKPTWVNYDYGWPDHTGGLIIEGVGSYKNGPVVWSNETIDGVYGMIVHSPSGKKDEDCPRIPKETGFNPEILEPFAIGAHDKDTPIDLCLLACNWKEVEQTGIDPCRDGTIERPTHMQPSCFRTFNFNGDGEWMGTCGFPCYAISQSTSHFCTKEQLDKGGECFVTCDPRDVKHDTSYSATQ